MRSYINVCDEVVGLIDFVLEVVSNERVKLRLFDRHLFQWVFHALPLNSLECKQRVLAFNLVGLAIGPFLRSAPVGSMIL